MTYELSIGLAALGQKVVVVTPWYNNKAKDKPEMMVKSGFKSEGCFDVEICKDKHKVEVFSGVHKGVTVYFLHNAELFPSVYSDEGGARHVIQ